MLAVALAGHESWIFVTALAISLSSFAWDVATQSVVSGTLSLPTSFLHFCRMLCRLLASLESALASCLLQNCCSAPSTQAPLGQSAVSVHALPSFVPPSQVRAVVVSSTQVTPLPGQSVAAVAVEHGRPTFAPPEHTLVSSAL